MKPWILRLLLLVALILTSIPASAQDQDESRLEPLDIQRECPDTPQINPFYVRDVLEKDSGEFLPQSLLTRRDYERVQERVANVAAECRQELLVEETQLFAVQIEELYNISHSANLDRQELAQHSGELLERTDRLAALVNYGTEPPIINVNPLPEEDLRVRVQRLVSLSRRLIPNLLTLSGQEAYDLDLLNRIRDDLAVTDTLTRALPESEF